MIERKRRKPIDGKPSRLGGVVSGPNAGLTLDPSHIGHGNRPAARIAPGISKRVKLLDADVFESRLFLQLAERGFFKRLILLDKTAGKRPFSLKGRTGAAN